jgi:hypothetical protein
MADEPQTAADGKGRDGFLNELSRSALKKMLAPLAATAATAGTAYLTRKTTQIWQESVLPKIQEKGGGKAFAKDALEQAATRLPGGRASGVLSGLAKRLDDEQPTATAGAQEAERPGGQPAEGQKPDPRREQERQERQRRRQQRQRTLEQSRST